MTAVALDLDRFANHDPVKVQRDTDSFTYDSSERLPRRSGWRVDPYENPDVIKTTRALQRVDHFIDRLIDAELAIHDMLRPVVALFARLVPKPPPATHREPFVPLVTFRGIRPADACERMRGLASAEAAE